MTPQEIKNKLSYHCGTENWWRHWIKPFTYTDGVKDMAEMCESYWLLDAIFSYRRNEPFQVWELKVDLEKSKAVLTMRTDSNKPILVQQKIPFTDFPLDEMKLWLVNGVLILPSEY